MTRAELIERICPTDNVSDCINGEYSTNMCNACDATLNEWFDEYDKTVRAAERQKITEILDSADEEEKHMYWHSILSQKL